MATKTTATTASSSSQETASQIKSLLKELPLDDRADAARLDELRVIFSTLIQQCDLTFSCAVSKKQQKQTATEKWNAWLQKHHKLAVAQLTSRIRKGRRTAVRTLWGLIAASPHTTSHGHVHVHAELLYQWLNAVVQMPLDVRQDKPMKHLLEAEWMQRDVQYYALRCITRWATERYNQLKNHSNKQGNKKETDDNDNDNADKGISSSEQADRMLFVLMMIPFPTTQGALDMPNNKYLFSPPTATETSKRDGSYEDASDDEENDEDDQDHNSSDDEEDVDSDDDEQPPHKKQRRTPQPKHFAFQDVKCHLKALSKAWMAILRLPLSTASLKRALPYLSQHVLPKIREPLRFADLFMKAYRGATGSDEDEEDDNGNGVAAAAIARHANTIIPLLALDGLFYLMTQHQLEYPHFYTQLYALLKPKLFYVKYRARFFALLQKCLLRNEMLPAHLVAAFLKRLLQCALQVPPPGALFVLALCSNLLRQHEECAAMVHRTSSPTADGTDPYNADTDDPVQSQALQSSLWELLALEKHYLPAVATLAQSIGREDPKSPMLQLDDMAQHSYASLIAQERKRKAVKKNSGPQKGKSAVTPVTFTSPTALFTENDIFAGILHAPSSTLSSASTNSE